MQFQGILPEKKYKNYTPTVAFSKKLEISFNVHGAALEYPTAGWGTRGTRGHETPSCYSVVLYAQMSHNQ